MGRFIQARSVSDGIGSTFEVTPSVASDPRLTPGACMGTRFRASDPPAYAGLLAKAARQGVSSLASAF